mgnify:FL=1
MEQVYYLRVHSLQAALGSSSVTLLGDGQLDTLTLWQGHVRLAGIGTDDEDVGLSGDESVLQSVLDVDQVETTLVLLSVDNNTNTSHVLTASDHGQLAGVELDELGDLTSGQVDLDSVVGSDQWVRVSDGSTVVGDGVRNTSLTQGDLSDLTQLVRGLLGGDSVHSESTLDVVDQSEVLVGGLQGDHVHEASREGRVGSDLTVDLDVLLHQDSLDLSAVQSVLQSVSQENDQRQRLSQLVGTGRWSWGVGAGQFVQHPVRWSCQSLKVLLWSSTHVVLLVCDGVRTFW